jgi:putative PIN family toxin of toxin-antitoxin system
MVDANIIISAGLFPESIVGKALLHIVKNHKLVLCKYTINEVKSAFKKKFPERIEIFNSFIKELKYELVDIDIRDQEKYPKIRDIDDLPLLVNAIETKVNILVTGDKDFDDIKVKNPRIMKPREYLESNLE